MITKSIIAAVVLSISAPAFANGNDQLALSIGVQPGVYTTAQLVALEDAIRDNDQDAVRYLKAQANDVASRASSTDAAIASNAGTAQYARTLGVEPGVYTLDELVRLDRANRENDVETQRFILSKTVPTVSDRGTVTPGKAQLADTLGVDPSEYTMAELVRLYSLSDLGGSN